MRATPKRLLLAAFGIANVAAAIFGGWLLLNRSHCVHAASVAYQLSEAIQRQDGEAIRSLLVPPPFIADRSAAERDLLPLELLSGEVSAEGLGILSKDAEFGPLREILPAQSIAWTQPYGLSPDQCFAFKLQRASLTGDWTSTGVSDPSILSRNDQTQWIKVTVPAEPHIKSGACGSESHSNRSK